MEKRHTHENRYCAQCVKTTRHEIRDHGKIYACQTCGTERRPSIVPIQKQAPESWWDWFNWFK